MKQAIPGLGEDQVPDISLAITRHARKQPSNEWQMLLLIISGLLNVLEGLNQKLKWMNTA